MDNKDRIRILYESTEEELNEFIERLDEIIYSYIDEKDTRTLRKMQDKWTKFIVPSRKYNIVEVSLTRTQVTKVLVAIPMDIDNEYDYALDNIIDNQDYIDDMEIDSDEWDFSYRDMTTIYTNINEESIDRYGIINNPSEEDY